MLPESVVVQEVQSLVDRRTPKLRATVRGGFSPVGQPDVKTIVIDVFSTVPVGWHDSEDLAAVIEPRTIDALRDLAELLFTSVQSELDPQFMIEACPKLKQWILREGIKPP